jgi:hypothetical protein
MKLKKCAALILALFVFGGAAVADAGQSTRSRRAAKSKRAAKAKQPAKTQESASPAAPAAQQPAPSDLPAKEQVKEEAAQPAEPGRITVEELKAKIAKNEPVVIIDSRSQGSYDGSETKIKGAIRIPLDQVESRLKEIPRDKEIVVYCT